MTVDVSEPRTRRALLTAAVSAAAVAAAAAMPTTVAAHDVDDVRLGADNATNARTQISASIAFDENTENDQASIVGVNSASGGLGVLGKNSSGTGVRGLGGEVGVKGRSANIGVFGAGDQIGVQGFAMSAGGIGVLGKVGDDGASAPQGVGMGGGALDDVGTGMMAWIGATPSPVPGVALQATAGADALTALQVNGRVRFSKAGKASMTSTQTSKAITKAGVTSSSYVIATLQTSVSGVYVRAVVPAAGKFTIYLSKAAGKTVYIGYLVIN